MGKVLHVLVIAVLTWNCVANSYNIRNMYRRMPVDRSSQDIAQIMLEKNSKVPTQLKSAKARQTSEPAGIPLPTLGTAAKKAVVGVRNDLSNLGGTIIGGFQKLTGLKLKKNPGYDDVLPFIPSLSPGHQSVKKSGSKKTKFIANKEREQQYKRQTIDFNSPPYAAQKDQKELPTIWYTEPKAPLHIKIGNDLKGVIDYFAPKGNLFIDENEVDTGAIRGERDSAYGAPVEPSYGAPAEPSYGVPSTPSYGAPVETSYGAPVEVSYGAPEISYDAPSYDHEDVLNTMVYGSEEKLPLLIKIITDYNKVFNFYAGQSAQIAAFYAPGLIPILRKFGFDVKRIRWVPEILDKLKPTEESNYGAPVAAYGEPAITYEQPEPAYGAPAPSYEQPEPSYGAPAPSYHEPAAGPSYQEPAPAYQPAATDPVPVYHAPDNGYAPPSHYAPPQYNHVLQAASSKRDKKHVKKVQGSSLDVVPEHHDELLTAVPALELLKLKTKLNKKEAREKIDKAESRSFLEVEESEEIETEDRTARLKELKDTLEKIEKIEEETVKKVVKEMKENEA